MINSIKAALSAKKQMKIMVTGNSMLPTYKTGDYITIRYIDSTVSIKINDVVLYCFEEHLILHRVIEIYEDWIVTKGDNHEFSDYIIKREDIIGVIENSPEPSKSLSAYVPTFLENIEFVFCDIDEDNLDRSIKTILDYYKINCYIETDQIELDTDYINIAINPGVNNTPDKILKKADLIDQKIRFFFNIKLSNHDKTGYIHYKQFNYVMRLGNYIPSFLFNLNQSVLVMLGLLQI